eukprot:scaffold312234_cov39-Attheya_sp.AAC.1
MSRAHGGASHAVAAAVQSATAHINTPRCVWHTHHVSLVSSCMLDAAYRFCLRLPYVFAQNIDTRYLLSPAYAKHKVRSGPVAQEI